MKFMEPGVYRVDLARGELTGATNRYVKTLADLDGLYEDAAAFEALKREWGDEVVRSHRLQAVSQSRRHDHWRHQDAAG